MELVQGMEAAHHSSRRLKGQEQLIKNVIGTPVKPQNSPQSCYRCEKLNHESAEWRFKDSSCNACGKKGHIAPACHFNPRRKYNSPEKSQKSKKKTYGTHQVHQHSNGNADSEEVRAKGQDTQCNFVACNLLHAINLFMCHKESHQFSTHATSRLQ